MQTAKFKTKTRALKKAVSDLTKAVIKKNASVPILENILFDIDPTGQIGLKASDLSACIEDCLFCTAEGDALKIAVPSKELTNLLKQVKSEEVEITAVLNDKGYTFTISAGGANFKLACENADDFPLFPRFEAKQSYAMASNKWIEAIETLSHTLCKEEVRPAITGLSVKFRHDYVEFASTNGHAISAYRVYKDADEQGACDVILPAKTLNVLKKYLKADGVVKIELGGEPVKRYDGSSTHSRIAFKTNGVTIKSRLIEDKYPAYESVIPTQFETTAKVNKAELIEGIKNVAIVTAEVKDCPIKFTVNGAINLIAENKDFDNLASVSVACEKEGADIAIAFNSKLILPMLNAIPKEFEEVELKFRGAGKALVINWERERGAEHENMTMLVMPVIVNEYTK